MVSFPAVVSIPTVASIRGEQGPLRYAVACWAVMALLCALLPAQIQAQWGLLLSPWFWAMLTIIAWQLRQPRTPRTRHRLRRHRGATRRSRRSREAARKDRSAVA